MSAARPVMAYDVPRAYAELIAPRYAPVAERLVALAAPQAGERVLELGAGTGLVTALAVARGADVVATDRSAAMLSHARERVSATFAELDYAEPFPFGDDAFSLVLSGLTYAQDADGTVAEIVRVLRPGGRVACAMWGEDYLELRLMQAAAARVGRPPLPAPDPAGVAARFARAGLAAVERHDFELAPRYASVPAYLEYRRAFGLPAGVDADLHERFLAALGAEAERHADADGSFPQGWSFSVITASH